MDVLDKQAQWLLKHLTPKVQRKMGVVMIYISLPLFVYGFFTNEPFLVYQMSAGALLFGGLTAIIAAVPSEKT